MNLQHSQNQHQFLHHMKFENQPKGFNKKQYVELAYSIWGCVPVDVDWAIGTSMYKERLKNI